MLRVFEREGEGQRGGGRVVGCAVGQGVDEAAFPAVALCKAAGRRGGTAPAVLNAANEVAVAAFLDRRIRFDQIHQVNHATLEAVGVSGIHDIEGLLALDAESRRVAGRIAKRLES